MVFILTFTFRKQNDHCVTAPAQFRSTNYYSFYYKGNSVFSSNCKLETKKVKCDENLMNTGHKIII